MAAEYHAGALVGTLGWWVRANFPHGPDEMARMIRELTTGGITAASPTMSPAQEARQAP